MRFEVIKNAGLKRCGKSCRLRWLNYLRPNIKHGYFTPEEDALILDLYSHMGSRCVCVCFYIYVPLCVCVCLFVFVCMVHYETDYELYS